MKEDARLYRVFFITSIFILLLNDLFLKYSYHNWVTGKLSDFAGLFAFPFFWACLFPKRIKTIYVSTAVLFIYWKSEISQPVLEIIQSSGVPIHRTVDYSDLIALSILPLSYLYWKSDFANSIKIRNTITVCIKGIAIVSFIATTLPKKTYDYKLKSGHEKIVKTDMETLRSLLEIYQLDEGESYHYDFPIPESNAEIHTKVIVTELEDDRLLIKLDSILLFTNESRSIHLTTEQKKYMRSLNISDIERLFDQEIDRQLNSK